jgi:hypothetical protein
LPVADFFRFFAVAGVGSQSSLTATAKKLKNPQQFANALIS